jgi:hypothetical protein
VNRENNEVVIRTKILIGNEVVVFGIVFGNVQG